jgi:homoserine kinase type II
MEHLTEITDFWNISLNTIRRDLEIAGSPERCEERVIVEDSSKRLFMLEKIFPSSVSHRTRISEMLIHLQKRDVECIPSYMVNRHGKFVACHREEFWQMSTYVEGIDLVRPDYVEDGWRGIAMADFLMALRTASADMSLYRKELPFSITAYIKDFSSTVRSCEPLLHESLLPIISFLDEHFIHAHGQLPLAFSHGDFHPLNVIWGPDNIRAVIDWEFAGLKPEIYDIALLVGCIGIENPEGLFGEMVRQLINTTREKDYISGISWDNLLEFVIAIRFAWMAEWLRKSDGEMVEMELAYLNLLVKYSALLKDTWQQM